MGGMITATVLAVFFVPVFFVVVMRLFKSKEVAAGDNVEAAPGAVHGHGHGHSVPAE